MGRPFIGKNITAHLRETNVHLKRLIFKANALIMNGCNEEEKKQENISEDKLI
jgi:hypothetical protein